jgi:Tol biopolymer transport system component
MTAVPSAAQVGSGRIAYAREGEGIYTLAVDGSGLVLLKPGLVRQPRWSPDGSRIAFAEYTTGGQTQIRVMNADGTGDHVVATSASGAPSR